jgi:hypothetical protein
MRFKGAKFPFSSENSRYKVQTIKLCIKKFATKGLWVENNFMHLIEKSNPIA